MARLSLRVPGHDLPGTDCGAYRHIHVGTRRGKDPDQFVRADAPRAVFGIPVGTTTAPDGGPDFRGPYVQGRRGVRFVCLTWGELPPDGEFTMFRRAKIQLADIPAGLLTATTLETSLSLTDPRGMPLCAAVRPPVITWRATATATVTATGTA